MISNAEISDKDPIDSVSRNISLKNESTISKITEEITASNDSDKIETNNEKTSVEKKDKINDVYDNLKKINLGNKEFPLRKCNTDSAKNKIIVTIENKPFELIVNKSSDIECQSSPTVNENRNYEQQDHLLKTFSECQSNLKNKGDINKREEKGPNDIDQNQESNKELNPDFQLKSPFEEWSKKPYFHIKQLDEENPNNINQNKEFNEELIRNFQLESSFDKWTNVPDLNIKSKEENSDNINENKESNEELKQDCQLKSLFDDWLSYMPYLSYINEPDKETLDNINQDFVINEKLYQEEPTTLEEFMHHKFWNNTIRKIIIRYLLSLFNDQVIENIGKELQDYLTKEITLAIKIDTEWKSNIMFRRSALNYLSILTSDLLKSKINEHLRVILNEELCSQTKSKENLETRTSKKINQNETEKINLENQEIEEGVNVKIKSNKGFASYITEMDKMDKMDILAKQRSSLETRPKNKFSKALNLLETEIKQSNKALWDLKTMGSSTQRSFFADDLFKFMMKKMNNPIVELPMYGTIQIDLYLMYRHVIARGGYIKVTENNLWRNVLKNLGHKSNCQFTQKFFKLIYEIFLYSYEQKRKSLFIKKSLANHKEDENNLFPYCDPVISTKSDILNTQTYSLTHILDEIILSQNSSYSSYQTEGKELEIKTRGKTNNDSSKIKNHEINESIIQLRNIACESETSLSSKTEPKIPQTNIETESIIKYTKDDYLLSKIKSELELALESESESESENKAIRKIVLKKEEQTQYLSLDSTLAETLMTIFSGVLFFYILYSEFYVYIKDRDLF